MSTERLASARIRKMRAYDTNAVSDETAIDTGEASLVQQQFKEEADVNTIVRRFGVGLGQLPPAVPAGVYGDFTGVHDFQSALERLEAAEAGFMSLPPNVREQFGNDPAAFVAYAQSRPEDVVVSELGLRPSVADRPAPVPDVPAVTPPSVVPPASPVVAPVPG